MANNNPRSGGAHEPAKRERAEPTQRELAQAGNALIEWFNTEGYTQSEATAIMSKVLAKIMIRALPEITVPGGARANLHEALDAFTFKLVNDLNAHIYANRKR